MIMHVREVKDYLEYQQCVDIRQNNARDVYLHVPAGWTALGGLPSLVIFLERFPSFRIREIIIHNGLLTIDVITTNSEELFLQEIITDFLVAVKRESARVCWVCGERGVRRKLESGSPCLCTKHYIEYVNLED